MKSKLEDQKRTKEEELRSNPLATKKELSRKYWSLPDNFFRQTINKIISEARGLDIEKAKRIRKITPKEYFLFVEEIEGVRLI